MPLPGQVLRKFSRTLTLKEQLLLINDIFSFSVNHLDIAPQHASVLMGIGNTFATIPGIVSPMLTGYLVVEQTSEEWKLVFFISAGIYLVGCVIYWMWASGELQEWAKTPEQKALEMTSQKSTTEGYVNEAMECKDEAKDS